MWRSIFLFYFWYIFSFFRNSVWHLCARPITNQYETNTHEPCTNGTYRTAIYYVRSDPVRECRTTRKPHTAAPLKRPTSHCVAFVEWGVDFPREGKKHLFIFLPISYIGHILYILKCFIFPFSSTFLLPPIFISSLPNTIRNRRISSWIFMPQQNLDQSYQTTLNINIIPAGIITRINCFRKHTNFNSNVKTGADKGGVMRSEVSKYICVMKITKGKESYETFKTTLSVKQTPRNIAWNEFRRQLTEIVNFLVSKWQRFPLKKKISKKNHHQNTLYSTFVRRKISIIFYKLRSIVYGRRKRNARLNMNCKTSKTLLNIRKYALKNNFLFLTTVMWETHFLFT